MRKYERMRTARDYIFMDIGGFLSGLGAMFGDLAYKTDASLSNKDTIIVSLNITLDDNSDEYDVLLNLTYSDETDFVSSLNISADLSPNQHRFIQYIYNIRFGEYTQIHTI